MEDRHHRAKDLYGKAQAVKEIKEMKSSKFIVMAITTVSLTITALTLNAQASEMTVQPVNAFKEQTAQVARASAIDGAMPALQKRQNGKWVKLTRSAAVRKSPGGKTIVRDGKPVALKAGQWFHLEPGVGTATWALGYCCVGGGKACNRHNSVPGFILRSALSPATAKHNVKHKVLFVIRTALNLVEASGVLRNAHPTFVSRLFGPLRAGMELVAPQNQVFNPSPMWLAPIASQNQERRICAREAWFRNDKLHRIGIFRKGDSIIVERYTDGSQSDKKRRWAIGTGLGRGIQPNRNHGRVLVTSLCR